MGRGTTEIEDQGTPGETLNTHCDDNSISMYIWENSAGQKRLTVDLYTTDGREYAMTYGIPETIEALEQIRDFVTDKLFELTRSEAA